MSSPFLDKFSPEVRAIIYGHVFGHGRAITPTTWLKKLLSQPEEYWDRSAIQFRDGDFSLLKRKIETNILAVNKQIFSEAIQVLYGNRSVRGPVARMQGLFTSQNVGFRDHARRVEIARCDEQHHDENLLPTLHKLQDLPQIRSIVILSDCLTEEFGIIDRGAPHLLMTVAKFAQNRDFAFNRGLSL